MGASSALRCRCPFIRFIGRPWFACFRWACAVYPRASRCARKASLTAWASAAVSLFFSARFLWAHMATSSLELSSWTSPSSRSRSCADPPSRGAERHQSSSNGRRDLTGLPHLHLLTGAQRPCASLKWSAEDLAGHCAFGVNTIRRAEVARRQLRLCLRMKWQFVGRSNQPVVEFIEENGGGPGVRLRKRQQKRS